MGWVQKKYLRDQSGQVAMVFALAALPLMALTSAAIDYSQLTKERNRISSALDAAVLAAANNNAISDANKHVYAESHFRANYDGALKLTLDPSISPARVRLAATGELNLTFGKLVGIKNPVLTEASAATLKSENTICVLALSEDDDGSISFDEGMEFIASGCAVHANSKSPKAIISEQKTTLPTASSFCAVGGVNGAVEPHAKGECSPVSDPYSGVSLAEEKVCSAQFTLEQSMATLSGRGTSSSTTAIISNAIQLPNKNPFEFDYIMGQLEANHGAETFLGEGYGGREGNKSGMIQDVAKQGGEDMRKLLVAYDAYGDGLLDCGNNPKTECFGFENPFEGKLPEEVPERWLVAEIFDISYGHLIPEVSTAPDIVRTGIVELINGRLYSRNNIDNELVPVSANLTGGDIVLTPGTYCGGLTVDGLRVRFSPGDYVFKDGPLTFLNQSEASADRVTFGFLGEGATLNVESGSKLTIRSATHGPRKGLAFMQMIDPDAPGNRAPVTGINRIASGGQINMSGTAYFPEQTLLISGEDTHLGANSPAVGLIADIIKFSGERGSRIKIAADHQKAGIPPIQPRVDDGVRLVE